jgi:hypothetical protein
MWILWHRPHSGAIWLEVESFKSRAEADRLMRLTTAPGEYVLKPAGIRPGPHSAPLFFKAERPKPKTKTRH